ncbi:MAG: hypothetical protein F6K09_05475 [Merismopedia sp. SIO2A8]|nr:hypothetical protein [Merismopedia sp. SIO2A8]
MITSTIASMITNSIGSTKSSPGRPVARGAMARMVNRQLTEKLITKMTEKQVVR